MRFLKIFGITLLSFICVLSLSTFTWLFALNTTILNPVSVKKWFSNSGAYNKVIDNVIQMPENQSSSVLTQTSTKQALSNTFTPSYIKQQTERTIDSIYDWVTGKSAGIRFSIPVDDKKTTFIQELSSAITTNVQNLPVCTATMQTARDQVVCRPADQSVGDFANAIANQSVNSSGILSQPITQQAISSKPADSTNTLSELPTYYAWVGRLLSILPLTIGLCALGILILAEDKLLAEIHLLRRLFISSAIILLIAAVMIYLGATLTAIPGFTTVQSSAVISNIALPIIRQLLSGIGQQLALVSGIITFSCLLLWLTLQWFHHKKHSPAIVTPTTVDAIPPVPTPENDQSK